MSQHGKDRKQRGRTTITAAPIAPVVPPAAPQGRRDTNPVYTGNARHAARASSPRRDVATRAR